MLFNSNEFLAFFAAFLLLYWLVRHRLTARNVLILGASYLFYGWWNWQFLLLLVGSSLFDFMVGLGLSRCVDPHRRKLLLTGSIVVNLGILGFFKYCDFFVQSLADLLQRAGWDVHWPVLNILLPWGISFYTFQSMSYALDVYRGQLQPTRNLINFLAYVAFFPQLIAGPIGRAARLLPQFETPRTVTRPMVEEGVWLILWGLFKKVALADSLAPLVSIVFGASTFSAPAVVLGTLAFGLQIYCDFSGYSDIARGLAKVLGFELMVNFHLPYFASDIREFWRRWHISLSTWLRDYLYVSLGGNRKGTTRTYFNLTVTMLLGGLWHGAAWHYVFWGAWHGLGLAVHRAWTARRPVPSLRPPSPSPSLDPVSADEGVWRPIAWLLTTCFVFYGWLLFRAESTGQVVAMTRALTVWTWPHWILPFCANLGLCGLPLVFCELWQARRGTEVSTLWPGRLTRGFVQGLLLLGILLFWQRKATQFIYFQF